LPGAQINVSYKVQLGAAVSGVYPFTFTYDDNTPNWLKQSSTPSGLLQGTPATTDVTSQPAVITVTVKDAQGKTMGPFLFSIVVSKDPPLVVAGSSAQTQQALTQAQQESPLPVPTLHEPLEDGATAVKGTAKPSAAVVLVSSSQGDKEHAVLRGLADQDGEFSIPVNGLKAGDDLEIRQVVNGVSSNSVQRIVTPYYRNGEELHAIMGYQQAGASAAKSEQNFFLDFYISRPLAFLKGHNDIEQTRLRWWGNVRVASYPQQGDIPVATFASSFVQQFGQLKVNQLAQSAEYLTGLDIRLLSSQFSFLGRDEDTRQHFNLSLFGGAGATGPMDPLSTLHVFEVPAPGSPQRPAFDKDFPGVTTPLIGFVSPDRDSFYRQYLVGLRLTTTYMDKYARSPLISAPAMFSVAVGQNESVTGGRLGGGVLRTEAFYPLPFFNRAQDRRGALAAIYLFGSSQIRMRRAQNLVPLILNPSTVSGSDPSVTIRSVPSNRDIYRIGFGIDLVHAIMALTNPPAASSSNVAPKPVTPALPVTPTTGGPVTNQ
jgi:hypothetical protein